ncbi:MULTISPECIES: NAD(P)/FAD-dependent oxidoreductase [unclassified Crossiella]|uniref:protoporphyrinogen/coproporphyrinogen oxidase n=1 Tax=unclassified Crossiella TaxID=2620835 RepID=UPI001FFEEC3E|nr:MULTISPECIES: FAD-dependent oxidoreductase [unclassified Crossiella]MCK2241554.1 FAD-dependent oxidoreductase [Crossiella sp. S99.2]MCK2255574.1 FAD-dependent oxidoreductase [Crossiella sp. S99.1]
MSTDLDVAVVGAGIAGLTLAHTLRQAGRSVRVFEAAEHVGGRMTTVRRDGYAIDTGAEQISGRGYDQTWRLLHELGVDPVAVPKVSGEVGMWRDGRAHAGVAHPRGVLTGAGLSPRARLDLVRLLVTGASRARTATVAEFGRRYHPDIGAYLLQPVTGGFFGWHQDRSAAAPFLHLLRMVGPSTGWRTYRDGMDTLARLLATRLDVTTGCAVREVLAGNGSARLSTDAGTFTARTVALCLPAPQARTIYVNPPAANQSYVDACTYTPMLKVSCLLDRPLGPECARELYCLLLPEIEDGVLGGIVVDHAKHRSRAPHGKGLLTLLAAPRAIPDLLDAPEDLVTGTLTTAAEKYVPGLAAALISAHSHRFRHGLPEATPAALRLQPAFHRRPPGPVEYAGDWILLRPNSEAAVRSALLAARRIQATTTLSPRREPA